MFSLKQSSTDPLIYVIWMKTSGCLLPDALIFCYRSFGSVGYVDCINCLCTFAGNVRVTEKSLGAIDMISTCTEKCMKTAHVGETSKETETALFTDSDADVKLWFPVLTGLSRLCCDPRLDVRARALQELFETLTKYGGFFSSGLWMLVYHGVLYPIFDDVFHVDEVRVPFSVCLLATSFLFSQCLLCVRWLLSC